MRPYTGMRLEEALVNWTTSREGSMKKLCVQAGIYTIMLAVLAVPATVMAQDR